MPRRDQHGIDVKLRKIASLFAERDRDSYEDLRSRMAEARELFYETMAERLAPSLNAHMASLPHDTMNAKQALTRYANAELRLLGLAIKCPRTGKPTMIYADQGRDPEAGRFQIVLIGNNDERKRTMSANLLPELELMRHPERREPGAMRWTERHARRRQERERDF